MVGVIVVALGMGVVGTFCLSYTGMKVFSVSADFSFSYIPRKKGKMYSYFQYPVY